MKLNFNPDSFAVPVDSKLTDLLARLTTQEAITDDAQSMVFNFRDKSYSAELGGYHPVEIRIYYELGLWHFDYITDFSYQGGAFPEITAEVDFDFRNQMLSVSYVPPIAITADIDFFKLWQGNFLAYVESGAAFDEVTVNGG